MESWDTGKGTKVTRLDKLRVNVYLIQTAGSTIMVDTSLASDRKKMEAALEELDITSLDAILITHAHVDHVGNAAYFQQKFGCPVYAHQFESMALLKGESKQPRGTGPIGKFITAVADKTKFMSTFEPCTDVHMLLQGATQVNFCKHIDVIATPGHSKGSMSIICDNAVACVGDALMGEKVFPTFADDVRKLYASWERLLHTECTVFLPGHGNAIVRDRVAEELRARRNWIVIEEAAPNPA